jgi:hypothetical protein
MISRDRLEECRREIRFADLDLASRTMAALWLGIFNDRVIRTCFHHVASQSLIKEVEDLINSTFFEGYILARAAEGTGTAAVIYSDANRQASVEAAVEKLRLMYEEEAGGDVPFAGAPMGVESLADSLVREIVYSPRLTWLEERELLKVHLIYAIWAGYRLAGFERRLYREKR